MARNRLERTPPGVSRRRLLASGAACVAASAGGASLGRAASSAPKNLIVVFAIGGWDTTYALDGKLGLPGIEGPEVDASGRPDDVNETRTFGEIPIVVNDLRRPGVTAFFERWHDRVTVVNGIFNGAIGHDLARNRMLTGGDSPLQPDLTVVFGVERGAELPAAAFDLTSAYQIAGDATASTARLTPRDQLSRTMDPLGHVPVAPAGRAYPLWVPSEDQDAALAAFNRRRVDVARARWTDGGFNDDRLDDDLEGRARSEQLRVATAGLDLEVPLHILARVPLALDLLSAGVTRSLLLHHEDFDTHYDTGQQNLVHDELFTGLDLLADGLEARGLLDETLVVVMSEMSRSPLRNAFGGKDHWPHANALFFGGGVPGDRVLGGTNGVGESLPVDLATGVRSDSGELLRHNQLVAGILATLDVDPAPWLPGVRPWGGLSA